MNEKLSQYQDFTMKLQFGDPDAIPPVLPDQKTFEFLMIHPYFANIVATEMVKYRFININTSLEEVYHLERAKEMVREEMFNWEFGTLHPMNRGRPGYDQSVCAWCRVVFEEGLLSYLACLHKMCWDCFVRHNKCKVCGCRPPAQAKNPAAASLLQVTTAVLPPAPSAASESDDIVL